MAGRSVAPARQQNYLGCPLEQGGALWVMQCGRAVLAGERGLLCWGRGVMEATGVVVILREIEWDCVIIQCALGCSLCWALERQVQGLCAHLSRQSDLLDDLVSCLFLTRLCALRTCLAPLVFNPHPGMSRGMWRMVSRSSVALLVSC